MLHVFKHVIKSHGFQHWHVDRYELHFTQRQVCYKFHQSIFIIITVMNKNLSLDWSEISCNFGLKMNCDCDYSINKIAR